MSILKASNVEYRYKNKYQTVVAVKDVSFEFENGVFYVIMGASGSGKTTFLSLLAGLDIASSGDIEFDGKSLKSIDRDDYRREHVSVIYQNFNLFSHLTVTENTAYSLYINGTDKQKADEIAHNSLRSVGLNEEYFKRLPGMLSGGEQQRVAIARALAAGSEIILADEPTGNLDSENSDNVVEILKRLAHEENRCVIVITHDTFVAEKADKVLRMRDGKLINN